MGRLGIEPSSVGLKGQCIALMLTPHSLRFLLAESLTLSSWFFSTGYATYTTRKQRQTKIGGDGLTPNHQTAQVSCGIPQKVPPGHYLSCTDAVDNDFLPPRAVWVV